MSNAATPRGIRVALAALGLCAGVYATASLSGGWLGTPPWWNARVFTPRMSPIAISTEQAVPPFIEGQFDGEPVFAPREGRGAISLGIAAVGLALFAWAAWPRRERKSRSR